MGTSSARSHCCAMSPAPPRSSRPHRCGCAPSHGTTSSPLSPVRRRSSRRGTSRLRTPRRRSASRRRRGVLQPRRFASTRRVIDAPPLVRSGCEDQRRRLCVGDSRPSRRSIAAASAASACRPARPRHDHVSRRALTTRASSWSAPRAAGDRSAMSRSSSADPADRTARARPRRRWIAGTRCSRPACLCGSAATSRSSSRQRFGGFAAEQVQLRPRDVGLDDVGCRPEGGEVRPGLRAAAQTRRHRRLRRVSDPCPASARPRPRPTRSRPLATPTTPTQSSYSASSSAPCSTQDLGQVRVRRGHADRIPGALPARRPRAPVQAPRPGPTGRRSTHSRRARSPRSLRRRCRRARCRSRAHGVCPATSASGRRGCVRATSSVISALANVADSPPPVRADGFVRWPRRPRRTGPGGPGSLRTSRAARRAARPRPRSVDPSRARRSTTDHAHCSREATEPLVDERRLQEHLRFGDRVAAPGCCRAAV